MTAWSISGTHGRALVVTGVLLALAGCAPTEEKTGGIVSSTMGFPGDPRLNELMIDARFDDVWPVVAGVVEARGYEDVELERSSGRETYRRTVEVEDQPRDETLRETVTEGRGTIVATTGDGRVVPLELRESHEWDMTTLDTVASLGGDESWTLMHEGVEIAVSTAYSDSVHPEETQAVFDELRAEFGG